jgi:hypothetical protein
LNLARWTKRNTSNLSHGRPPFLNPLGRGEALAFASSDSGFPSCYAWFQNDVPPRKDSVFEGGADTRTKTNKNWVHWSENIQTGNLRAWYFTRPLRVQFDAKYPEVH